MNFIDQIAASYRPALDTAAQSARAYADRICHGLTAIHAAISDLERTHDYFYTNAVLPASPGRIVIAEIPAGQVWELEMLSGDEQVTAFNMLVQADGLHIARYSGTVSLPGALRPPRIVGPAQVTVGHTKASPQNIRAQFRVLKPRPHRTHSAGQITAGIAPTAAERIHAPEHTGLGIG